LHLHESDELVHSQGSNHGTMHKCRELFDTTVQRIDLEETIIAGNLLRRLRAPTTNDAGEAAYFEVGQKRYRV
jgi:hypothetical protein